MENRGLKEDKLKLFDENTRFVSSYKEAKIITLDEDEHYQLSMLLNGIVKIYSFGSFTEAYDEYLRLLKNDDKGVFI